MLSREDRAYKLDGQSNQQRNLSEGYCYDELNRLISIEKNPGSVSNLSAICNSLSQADQDIRYDDRGNILYKSDLGTYAYGGSQPSTISRPHAVTSITKSNGVVQTFSYDNNGNLKNDKLNGNLHRSSIYTTFDKPSEILKGDHTIKFEYGIDRSRFYRKDSKAGNQIKKTEYLGGVEKVTENGKTKWKRHLGKTAIITITSSEGQFVQESREEAYVYTDHLGSIDVITDEVGSPQQGMSFDAWGARRDKDNWTQLDVEQFIANSPLLISLHQFTTRGYTGHETLDEVGLIHMNGRIYDPIVARFMQADPIVQAATHTQSYNRYSYVWNNPLNATDPSGYQVRWGEVQAGVRQAVQIVASIAVSMTGCIPCIMAVSAAFAAMNGADNTGMFMAALTAGFTAGMHWATKAVAMGVVGGITSLMNGGRAEHGFLSASLGSASGAIPGVDSSALVRVGVAAMVGGTVSDATGGKFANGAATAAFSAALSAGLSKASGSDKNSFLRGDNDPDDAMTEYWANRGDLDLSVDENGVLVGDVDVGCKIATDQCNAAFGDLESINEHEKINIKFNRHTVFKDNSALDLEIKFTTFPLGGDGSQKMGHFIKGKPGGFFTRREAGVIEFDYRTIEHKSQQGIVLHEFGHALGHAHMVNSSNSIMSYSRNARSNFVDGEVDALIKAYR